MKIDTILLIIIGGLWYLDKGSFYVRIMRKNQFEKDGSEIPFLGTFFLFLFWPITIVTNLVWPAEKL